MINSRLKEEATRSDGRSSSYANSCEQDGTGAQAL
jgi:hypothetical protein